MKISITAWLMSAVMLLGSCERITIESGEPDSEADQASSLNEFAVKTRGVVTYDEKAGETKEKVSYPVYLYAFDSRNKCVGRERVASADDPIQFSLIKGSYTICALGIDIEDRYTIPAQSTAQPTSLVKLKSGLGHADLMSSTANVVVEEGEENTVTMQMERKVLRVDDVTLRNIPSDVTGVKVTISPLGNDIQINGTLSGTSGYSTISLAKDAEPGTWSNEDSLYLLASDSRATIKVALEYGDDGETKAYTYTSEEVLEKNYIVNITGVFKAKEIILSGTLKGVDWAGSKNISFLMDEVSGDTKTIPAVGTIYKGCYVLRHYQEGQNTTVVTLMSLKEKTGLKFDYEENQSSASAAIAEGLEELSEGSLPLRMPDLQERRYLAANINEINEGLKRLKATPISLNQVNADGSPKDRVGYYFRRTTNGKLSLFFINGGKTDSQDELLPSESKFYHLRGFATLTF